jgi:hypothetical protein
MFLGRLDSSEFRTTSHEGDLLSHSELKKKIGACPGEDLQGQTRFAPTIH